MARSDRIPGFPTAAAQEAFLRAYDGALERLWPVPLVPEDVPTGVGTVRVYHAGERGPDPFVLLAGAGGNAVGWYPYVAPLAAHRPVVVVDPPGEPGRSVQTAPAYTAEAAAGWLDEVLVAVRAERAHLVGVSFGGWVSIEHERRRPGRVAAVTLVDPAGLIRLGWPFYRWLLACGLAGMVLPAGLRRRAARRLHNATLADDELMRLLRAGIRFRRPVTNIAVWDDDELREVPTPVQVLLGELSPGGEAAATASRLAAVVPGWRVEVVPGAGHAVSMDAPATVIDRVLAFSPTARS